MSIAVMIVIMIIKYLAFLYGFRLMASGILIHLPFNVNPDPIAQGAFLIYAAFSFTATLK